MGFTEYMGNMGLRLRKVQEMLPQDHSRVAIDHIAFPINPHQPLGQVTDVFTRLGFCQEWYRERVGDEKTAMETVVMSLDDVKFAIMRGLDNTLLDGRRIVSQVNEYFARFGSAPQHYAIRVPHIRSFVDGWSKTGVRFITVNADGTPRILVATEEDGSVVLQSFTYPLMGVVIPFFFEVKQVVLPHEAGTIEEFRDANVEGLWESLDRVLAQEDIFAKNIFGESVDIPPRYHI